MSSVSGPRPSLGRAGILACPFPHGAAPTPDGEWAPPTPHTGKALRPRSSVTHLHPPSFFSAGLLRPNPRCSPLLPASQPAACPLCQPVPSSDPLWVPRFRPGHSWGEGSVGKRLGGGTCQVSLSSTGFGTQRAIPECSLLECYLNRGCCNFLPLFSNSLPAQGWGMGRTGRNCR